MARLRSTHAAETERADSAEAAARAGQEEVHRLCSGGEDALQQTKAALTAAKQENDALQAELDQVKADSASNAAAREGEQRQAAATRAELQQAQSNHAAERQRADAAETASKQSQETHQRAAVEAAAAPGEHVIWHDFVLAISGENLCENQGGHQG